MSNKITIYCPHCEKQYNVSEAQLGKKATCKACGEKFVLKSADTSNGAEDKSPSISPQHSQTSAPEPEVRSKGIFGKFKDALSDAAKEAGDKYREVKAQSERQSIEATESDSEKTDKPKSFWEKAKEAGQKLQEKNKEFLENQKAQLPLKYLHGPFGSVKPGSPVYLKFEDDVLIVDVQVMIKREEAFRIALESITGTEVETAERMTLGRVGAGLLLAGPFGALLGGFGFKKKDKLLRLDFSDDGVESSIIFGKGAGKSVEEVNGRIHDALREFRKRTGTKLIEAETKPESSETDITESIQKLAALRDQGILTDEEFTTKKSELLSRM